MINILIADQSYIIGSGFYAFLDQFDQISQIKVVDNSSDCLEAIESLLPKIILINTSMLSQEVENKVDELLTKDTHVLYLFNSALPTEAPRNQISLLHSKAEIFDRIQEVLNKVKSVQSSDSETQELSPREKLILKCVALGLTNKEIGEKEFISTHTVISHRKNITRKLGIKTVSGLTVYAIINNIIHMNDIN